MTAPLAGTSQSANAEISYRRAKLAGSFPQPTHPHIRRWTRRHHRAR